MKNPCPLYKNNKCRATDLFCFWETKEPDRWCLTYQNAYNCGLKDGIDRCTQKVRMVIEGYKDVKPFCEDDETD